MHNYYSLTHTHTHMLALLTKKRPSRYIARRRKRGWYRWAFDTSHRLYFHKCFSRPLDVFANACQHANSGARWMTALLGERTATIIIVSLLHVVHLKWFVLFVAESRTEVTLKRVAGKMGVWAAMNIPTARAIDSSICRGISSARARALMCHCVHHVQWKLFGRTQLHQVICRRWIITRVASSNWIIWDADAWRETRTPFFICKSDLEKKYGLKTIIK